MLIYRELADLAQLCAYNSRITREVACVLWQMASEYRLRPPS